MADEDIVMTIDKPHFVVKLHKTVLEVDLKKGVRKELEDFLEAKPALRESLGLLFQTVVPLDVKLKDITSVGLDKNGRVKVAIPSKKDLTIPLDAAESQRLIDKLNELIPPEKERAIREIAEAKKTEEAHRSRQHAAEKDFSRVWPEK